MKKFFSVLFVLALVFLAYAYFHSKTGKGVRVEVENKDETGQYFKIHLEYPQFPDLPKSFNSEIESSLLALSEQFKTSAVENAKMRQQTAPPEAQLSSEDLTFNSEWSHGILNKDKVSIILRTYFYSGGAHGGHQILTFNFDVKRNKEITLDDVFSGIPNYLQKISVASRQKLMDHLKEVSGTTPNEQMLDSGTAPDIKNFSKFTLDRYNNITFYFEEYQVAPYAAGEQQLTINIDSIK